MARAHSTPIVAVLNMKGGVGKTTIAGNVFRNVFTLKRTSILLVDFDAQFNLSQLLLTRADYETFEQAGRTIYSVLQHPPTDSVFAVSKDFHEQLPPTQDVTTPLEEIAGPPAIALRLLPGDFRLAMMNIRDMSTLRLPRRRLEAFVERARGEFGCVVLDCNPSSSFVTRCAIEMATHVLIPVRPDKFSVLGVEMLHKYMRHLRGPSTPDVRIVLNEVATVAAVQNIISDLRANATYGPLVLTNEIRQSDVLKARSDYTGFATDRRPPHWREIDGLLTGVASEYAGYLGL